MVLALDYSGGKQRRNEITTSLQGAAFYFPKMKSRRSVRGNKPMVEHRGRPCIRAEHAVHTMVGIPRPDLWVHRRGAPVAGRPVIARITASRRSPDVTELNLSSPARPSPGARGGTRRDENDGARAAPLLQMRTTGVQPRSESSIPGRQHARALLTTHSRLLSNEPVGSYLPQTGTTSSCGNRDAFFFLFFSFLFSNPAHCAQP